MATSDGPKSEQVSRLEQALQRQLEPRDSEVWAPGTYWLNEDGEIVALSLAGCEIADCSPLAGLTNLTGLNLSGNELRDCSSLAGLTNLTDLNLSGNELRDCSFLAGLTNLTRLDFGRNELRNCSPLRALRNLTVLNLKGNELRDCSSLAGLTNLTALNLSGNELRDCSFLAGLTNLRALDLHGNQLRDCTSLASLTSLRVINLHGNQLRDCSSLAGLANLNELYLSDNQLSNIDWLCGLSGLRKVGLTHNNIQALPRNVLSLDIDIAYKENYFTNGISLFGNPLQDPPPEIIEQGREAISAWLLDDDRRPLNEAKVILVGDGGAGKTSLRKRLMGQPFDKHESQTHGVDIQRWSSDSGTDQILVHFWDFGGQQIMHATHQFFLSRRCVYLLVLDGRKEEDAEYWLEQTRIFGGDSPVFIVLNKIDENPSFEVDRRGLLAKYPGVQFFRVSCAATREDGIAALQDALLRQLRDLKLVTAVWPRAWFHVKTWLESKNADFLEYDEFTTLCDEADVPHDTVQKILVRYLHDLGVVLHFEDPRLKTTQVLKPSWVTEGVYRIINAPELARAQGVLALSLLDSILAPRDASDYHYPPDKHSFIVDLMRKFELCYELDSNHMLVPDLLDVQEPAYDDFSATEVLRFRFEYEFLPRSVMPRFIVAEHDDIDDGLRWRTGVVLRDPETSARALVKADNRARTISITVEGPKRRDYFKQLRRTFNRIHNSFETLPITEMVPLPDQPQHAVEYLELMGLEEMDKPTITIGKLKREYSVAQLLDGIEPKRDRVERREQRDREAREPHVTNKYNITNINNSHGVQVAADSSAVKVRDNQASRASASDEVLSQEQWQADVEQILHALIDRMDELESDQWMTLTAIFKRLSDLEMSGRAPSEALAVVDEALSEKDRKVLKEAGKSVRSILESVASSGVWHLLAQALSIA